MRKNKDWVFETLAHRESRAVPFFFDFTPMAREKVERHYGSPIEEVLNYPIRMGSYNSIKPLYAFPEKFGDKARDEWGVEWSTSKIDRGSPIHPCLPEADLSSYTFPDFSVSYRFEDLGEWCENNKEHFTVVWVGDFWERATFMRGMENILMDLVLNPGFVEGLLQGIADYIIGTMEIMFDRFEFDCIALSDDYGTQKSLLMSPADWRRFIKPHLSKIYGLAKKHGRKILHHSDGNIYTVIQDMVDMGLDILHPVQPETMDISKVKSEFGRDLTFFGGMRSQDLLPLGTPEEIREEVRKLKRIMGANGGYIVSNGITLQADVPMENLIALIDEAREGN